MSFLYQRLLHMCYSVFRKNGYKDMETGVLLQF